MRKIILGGILGALSSALPIAALTRSHHMGQTRYSAAWRGGGRNFHPRLNRWTGKPHEHRREISRRLARGW
jgi:hypothetical protein